MDSIDFQNGFALGMASGGVVEQDYTLPIGGDELGGVKNGGNVVINEDGTMTAPASGGSEEEWVELLNTTLTEDVAYVDLAAPDGKKFKKIHIHVNTGDAGLSAASKICIKGGYNAWLESNQNYLTITASTVNTWAYPTFIIEKGALFPIAFSSQGAYDARTATTVLMGGVGLSQKYNTPNNGGWKVIRIQPQTADVVFKAGVAIYAWGVYE